MKTPMPTDQRAGARPISFLLQNGNSFGSPITLKIRPTDLTRNEPSRASVRQTLSRGDVQGWVDDFGVGLPSVNISGHTGWRYAAGTGQDGVAAFLELNRLITQDFPRARQAAIDSGLDPASVKLIFTDMLDEFAWNVMPMMFQLQRSKSQPLLMRYTIQLQAISTRIDDPSVSLPFLGNLPAGLGALGAVLSKLQSFASTIQGLVSKAIAIKDAALTPIANTVKAFTDVSNAILGTVNSILNSGKSLVSSTVNSVMGIASNIASVGVNLFRTVSNIANLPAFVRSQLGQVAAAYNEVVCIFRNSLRPKKLYEDYSSLYGASNCSSTTGGRPSSSYLNVNPFDLIQPSSGVIQVNSAAIAGISAITRSDPVLAPMPLGELGRNLGSINAGVRINAEAAA